MATIDKLDISVYNLYAIRTRMIEQINQQYHLDEAATIPPQTSIIANAPQLTEIDLLLGILPMHTPWAYFYPPKRFRFLRRSPFSFSKVAPSLWGDGADSDLMDQLNSIPTTSSEDEEEKATLRKGFAQMGKINQWLGFIIGRVGQFLQG